MLANLAPGDVEETKILVPSLMVRRAFRLLHSLTFSITLTAYDIMSVCHTSSLILLTSSLFCMFRERYQKTN